MLFIYEFRKNSCFKNNCGYFQIVYQNLAKQMYKHATVTIPFPKSQTVRAKDRPRQSAYSRYKFLRSSQLKWPAMVSAF